MNNNIIRKIQKYKHLIIISLIAAALSLYMLPVEKIFTDIATAQTERGRPSDGPYEHVRQGPPRETRGEGPPEPGETPGRGPPEDRGPPAPRGPPS
jgi:hypothetical protein